MAAEGGKTNKLAMHLDKIAYGTALVLGVVIVLLPVWATSDLNQVIRGLPEQQRAVAEMIEQEPPPIDVPDLKKKLRDQWEVSLARGEKWLPPWSIDARPAVVKLIKVAGKQAATHEAGQIAKVIYQRDSDPKKQQVFVRVEATTGTVERAKFTKIRLLRAEVKDGAPGEFKEIAELKADKLTYDDYQVEPGKLYAYQLVTEVAIDGDQVEIADENVKKESAPLVMFNAVPYDFAIRILTATGATGTGTPPSMAGEITFWDYEASKLVKVSKPKWAEKEAFAKNGYVIFQIEDSKVVINDLKTRDKTTIKAGDPQRPVELPADLTAESVNEHNKPKEPEPEPEKDEKKAAPKAEPEKKAPTKKTEGTKDTKKPKDTKSDKDKKPKRQVK